MEARPTRTGLLIKENGDLVPEALGFRIPSVRIDPKIDYPPPRA